MRGNLHITSTWYCYVYFLSFIDRNKPEFTSERPSDQSVIADKGKTDKIVSWSAITAEDNDGEVPDMEVTPEGISPTATSHKFSEGIHVVTFTARDRRGNSRSCSFRVEVKGSRCRLFMYALMKAVASNRQPRHFPQLCFPCLLLFLIINTLNSYIARELNLGHCLRHHFFIIFSLGSLR